MQFIYQFWFQQTYYKKNIFKIIRKISICSIIIFGFVGITMICYCCSILIGRDSCRSYRRNDKGPRICYELLWKFPPSPSFLLLFLPKRTISPKAKKIGLGAMGSCSHNGPTWHLGVLAEWKCPWDGWMGWRRVTETSVPGRRLVSAVWWSEPRRGRVCM